MTLNSESALPAAEDRFFGAPGLRTTWASDPRCGGRLRLIATVEDPDAIRTILAAALSRDLPDPSAFVSHGAGHQPDDCHHRRDEDVGVAAP
jgi:hypothetical protein